jgi:hypothetical protein
MMTTRWHRAHNLALASFGAGGHRCAAMAHVLSACLYCCVRQCSALVGASAEATVDKFDCLQINLWISALTWIIVAAATDLSFLGGIYFCFSYIGYTVEWCISGTRKFLSHIQHEYSAYQYVDKLREAPPSISFHAKCWHYETRYRTVTHTDAQGRSYTTTEAYQEMVVTHQRAFCLLKLHDWQACCMRNVHICARLHTACSVAAFQQAMRCDSDACVRTAESKHSVPAMCLGFESAWGTRVGHHKLHATQCCADPACQAPMLTCEYLQVPKDITLHDGKTCPSRCPS